MDFWEYNPKENKGRKRKYLPIDYSFRNSVSFTSNGKGYFVTGTDGGDYEKYRKLYEYDPETNTWTHKNDFPVKCNVSFIVCAVLCFYVCLDVTDYILLYNPYRRTDQGKSL